MAMDTFLIPHDFPIPNGVHLIPLQSMFFFPNAWEITEVCLFTTLMLLELQGSRRSVDISWLISKVS